MRAALLLHEGAVTVARLQQWCPQASRRALAAWLQQQRRAHRRQLRHLRWMRAGRVWAMDLSEAPQRIDDRYRYVLHVRDLASQYYLAAHPVRRGSARVVCDLVRAICTRAAPPLVLKVDNGSPFVSRALQAWAHRVGTRLLYSPPGCPRYNGSIEASIGALTTRAHEVAAAAGHPEWWTSHDVELARALANQTTCATPQRTTACTAWRVASPVTTRERRRFGRHYTRLLDRDATGARPATRAQQRTALVRTLTELGYVSIKRRADLVHELEKKKRQRLRA
jgi:transposase InsO family protein